MTNCTTNIQIKPISLTAAQFEQIKASLSQQEWAVFLESADTQHPDSQWSIFSAMPIATVQSVNGLHTIQQGQLQSTSEQDAFALLNELRHSIFYSTEMLESAPFSGGLLGVIDYELGYQFEKISNKTNPIGLNIPEISVGFYDWALLVNVHTKQYQLAVHNTKGSNISLEKHWSACLQRLRSFAEPIVNSIQQRTFSLSSDWSANMTKQQYSEKFSKIQDYILSGDCYQVNLAQRFNATYQGDEYHAYQVLLAENSPPFAAFLRLPSHTILSLSPERFLKLNKHIVETKPIKGTRPRFLDAAKDALSQYELLHSEKDRSENLMIVDLLRNDIGRVCDAGSVKVPQLFNIESFPAVHHLVSTIKGKLAAQYQVEDLLRACFPGGSITGAPKIRAMEIIAELEPHRRHSYCGSIGYINSNGEMDMNIAIRTLLCFEGQIYCWAGGGLVADSEINSEYQECFDKVSKILPCLEQLKTSG